MFSPISVEESRAGHRRLRRTSSGSAGGLQVVGGNPKSPREDGEGSAGSPRSAPGGDSGGGAPSPAGSVRGAARMGAPVPLPKIRFVPARLLCGAGGGNERSRGTPHRAPFLPSGVGDVAGCRRGHLFAAPYGAKIKATSPCLSRSPHERAFLVVCSVCFSRT